MTTLKEQQDIMIDSFKALSDVLRDLEDKHENDPQSMLRGALHALYTQVLCNAPTPMLAVSFLLEELKHFTEINSDILKDELKWGRSTGDLEEEEDTDGTLH
tara:strand:+ start:638 stop:943 length:306 start_codon:yes stop_codon:yes gene_type:complete